LSDTADIEILGLLQPTHCSGYLFCRCCAMLMVK